MAFQGSLKELPLPDIIQLVSVSGKTGVFVLQTAGQRGEIFLRDGEIVHAVAGPVEGEEAVYELAIWQEGEFVFNAGVATDKHTIEKSNTNLLMEAARRIDEWQVLSKRIPSTRLVPVFTNHSSGTSLSFTAREWSVITKIDERRSIEDLAKTLELSPFELCKLLYGLVTAGLVDLSGHFPIERLRDLTPTKLSELAQRIQDEATSLLAANVDRQPQLAAAGQRARAEMDSGRGADAVVDMIRNLEQVVSGALGPNQSRLFVERIQQLLGG